MLLRYLSKYGTISEITIINFYKEMEGLSNRPGVHVNPILFLETGQHTQMLSFIMNIFGSQKYWFSKKKSIPSVDLCRQS